MSESAADLFRTTYQAEPSAVFSAPGRVNLIGEHTDYNDGFVFPFAIQYRTQVAVSPREDDILRVVSTHDEEQVSMRISELETLFPRTETLPIPLWSAYPLGVVWAMMQAYPDAAATGIEFAFSSDVPIGAGLSSSAAIEGATAFAISQLWNLSADPVTRAQAGRRAENEAVGAPTGIMDQMAVNLGEADAALFLDCRSLQAEVVPLGFTSAGLVVVVIDTNVKHSHATGGYGERRASCELGAKLMGVSSLRDLDTDDLPRAETVLDEVTFRRVRHILTENQRVLDTVRTLREQGPAAIGELLITSHESMRDDFEISAPELDTAVTAALSAGALGARMTGGGFGGAAIALVAEQDVDRISTAVRLAFSHAGHKSPHIFTVTPSDGPRKHS